MATFFGPTVRISQVHGTTRPWRDILAYACFHPAAALHQAKFREQLEEDFAGLPRALEKARERAAEPAPPAPGLLAASDPPPERAAGDEQLNLF